MSIRSIIPRPELENNSYLNFTEAQLLEMPDNVEAQVTLLERIDGFQTERRFGEKETLKMSCQTANSGHPFAMARVCLWGSSFCKGMDFAEVRDLRKSLLKGCVKRGYIIGVYTYAKSIEFGLEVGYVHCMRWRVNSDMEKKEFQKAKKYFRIAALKEYAPAMYCLGCMLCFENGNGFFDFSWRGEGYEWIYRAALKGYIPAVHALGLCRLKTPFPVYGHPYNELFALVLFLLCRKMNGKKNKSRFFSDAEKRTYLPKLTDPARVLIGSRLRTLDPIEALFYKNFYIEKSDYRDLHVHFTHSKMNQTISRVIAELLPMPIAEEVVEYICFF